MKGRVVNQVPLTSIFALFFLLCSGIVSLLPESVQSSLLINFLKIHEADAATCSVTNTNDTGAGSLRDCITTANGTPGTTINFNIATAANANDGPGNSWWRITVVSLLPAITANNTVIDGTTQPGNTNSKGPEIEIYGGSAPNSTSGLTINNASGVTIKGLVVNGFKSGVSSGGTGILITGASAANNKVQGNYIGTDATGTSAVGNYDGVIISNAGTGNTIGGTAAGAGNVISGNWHEGLWVHNTSGAVIQGNYIGVNSVGNVAIPNGIDGIRLQYAPGTTIGGADAGARNVIPGKRYMASCRSKPSLILNNFITEEPVEVLGNVEAFTVLFNAKVFDLPSGDIRIRGNAIDEIIEVKGDELDKPVEFQVNTSSPETVTSWALKIMDLKGDILRTIKGTGPPSPTLFWNGHTDQNTILKGGEVYQYHLEVEYNDGSHATSPIRLFGLARTSAVEVKGEFKDEGRPEILDQHRTVPLVRINRASIDIDDFGRFSQKIEEKFDHIEFEMKDIQGRSVQTLVPLPTIDLQVPSQEILLSYKRTSKKTGDEQSHSDQNGKTKEVEAQYSVKGKTDKDNALKMNGQVVKVEQDGTFTLNLHLKEGENIYLIEITNPAGYTRYTRLTIRATMEKASQTTEKEVRETQLTKIIHGAERLFTEISEAIT